MATNLRKGKHSSSAAVRPDTASEQTIAKAGSSAPPSPSRCEADALSLKSDILAAIKTDISVVIKSEIKEALAEEFTFIKGELQAVRAEVANGTMLLRADLDHVKQSVKEVEDGLSTWSDEVVTLRTTVLELKEEVDGLKKKCDDMEGRMRRCNLRIIGVPETPESSSTEAVAKLLAAVLQMDKAPLIDRVHRTGGGSKSGDKPRIIVAKLHYYQECVEILRRARSRGPLRFKEAPIIITSDYTAAVARARAAFSEVRRLLRNRRDVRYGLLFPARLRISHGEEDKEFLDANKAMDYVKKKIISATASEDRR